ncbi:unnamed protein product [Polarella glacialis]|uniref:GRF-type domain-containing protein n=1 Tax=Polarella glacialis TaxID=89957 RepID=A0A813JVA9_POLGL|nr:unnamed protein product [Polarella glacialis]
MLQQLQERCAAKQREVGVSRERLRDLRSETASLELQLEEASVVRGGPPLCDCGDEMVHREVCNMADPNWGRHFWKCPRRPVCCERREWDDSVPATDISCARIGG